MLDTFNMCVDVKSLIGGVKHDLKEGHNDQLEATNMTQQCTHCDENDSCSKG